MSMPIHWRFSFCATATAVPQPQNGSSTTSPSLRTRLDDPLQKSFGLLRGIAETLGARPTLVDTEGSNIIPESVTRTACHLV